MKKIYNVAIIGCGKMGEEHIKDIYYREDEELSEGIEYVEESESLNEDSDEVEENDT